MSIIIAGMFVCLKMFYKKAKPGEVIILNNLEAQPKVIRNGVLVLPMIHSSSTIDLTVQVIDIKPSIMEKVNEAFSLDLSSFSVQVNNTEQGIVQAYQRISNSDNSLNHKNQLRSILEQSIQESLLSTNNYEKFKKDVSSNLNDVGYELVV